ncbi:MAG: ATP-dependent DNA helicase RecQ [Bacteroidota bacterium]
MSILTLPPPTVPMPAAPAASEAAVSDAAIDAALREHFGFDALRRGQREAVASVLGGSDTLVVMPTGAGKSLVYQLSACLSDGVTVVISPLIALMKDQVDALHRRGIPAVALNSSQGEDERREGLQALRSGDVRLVYVAPERLRNRAFLGALAEASVALLAVDEAHCVSQWGHDFRPDYLQIARARQRMGNPTTVALTATATPRVQDDILATLGIDQAARVVTGFNRPNLFFNVQATPTANDKRRALRAFLGEHEGEAGLVYVSTRKQCEDVARFIKDEVGHAVRAYHAGLPDAERTEVQDEFMTGGLDLVVATNAFGMGVDRADVRFVVHWGIPATLEAYYQEAGRAGRDGEPAEALLFYATHDASLREWFIEQYAPAERDLRAIHRHLVREAESEWVTVDQEVVAERVDQHPVGARVGISLLERMGVLERGEDLGPLRQYAVRGWDSERAGRVLERSAERQRAKRRSLARMTAYAESDACRRQLLLDHFGDPEPPVAERCCDNCLVAAELAEAPDELPAFESLPMAARIAIGLLDLVRRLRWSVGRKTLVKILSGSKAAGMDRREYTESPYYGRLGYLSQDDIDSLYKQLIATGYLKVVGSEFPVVELTVSGKRALAHREAIALDMPASASRSTASKGSSAAVPDAPLGAEAAGLLVDLKSWRTEQAREQEVPPYVVFNDRTLEALARARPQNDEDLLAVKGIGPAKLERYGADLLALLAGEDGG